MSAILTPDQIEIADGLTLADLTTVEDHDMALLTLSRDINRIEEQLADPMQQDQHWSERAESALRFKKSLRQTVTQRLADLRRTARAGLTDAKNQLLVSQFKADWPTQFDMSAAHARDLRPELWGD